MRILLIEDDFSQAEPILKALEKGFPGAEIRHLTTESEFRSRLHEIVQNLPALAIIDVMVRWADPGPDMPEAPPEVQRESYFRAGVRCARLLEQQSPKKIPIVFYTILERNNSEPDWGYSPNEIVHLRKGSDLDQSDLVQLVRSLLHSSKP